MVWWSRDGGCEKVVVTEATYTKGLDCQPGVPRLRRSREEVLDGS